MPLFRGQRFPPRLRRRKRATAADAGDKTMQGELKNLVNTVAGPPAKKVMRFTIYLPSHIS